MDVGLCLKEMSVDDFKHVLILTAHSLLLFLSIFYHFPMQISVNEQRIEQVKEMVFLGVVLDEHLTWKPLISQVAGNIFE